jgi:hypothetical protein
MISAPAPAARLSAGDLRKITVDAGAPVGHLRSLQGVNGAPAPGAHKPENFKFGGWNMPERVDVSTGYKMARIDLVRTHDAYGPTDIDAKFETADAPGGGLISAHRDVFNIFPDPNADPNDPRSYNFAPTDQIIASIRKVGAQVMFRLGRSEGADAHPPKDFDKYAAIAKHVVMHYNRGWAHGFHYHIRYWEIWNEPDLGKVFWAGTAQQYYELYGKLAGAVKAADPHALVGGPAIARPNDDTPYRDAFLEYVRTEHLPLDFYSWHWYATDSNDPLDFTRIAKDIRAPIPAPWSPSGTTASWTRRRHPYNAQASLQPPSSTCRMRRSMQPTCIVRTAYSAPTAPRRTKPARRSSRWDDSRTHPIVCESAARI